MVHRWSETATDTDLARTELAAVPGLQRTTTQSSLRRLRKLVCVLRAARGPEAAALRPGHDT